MYKFFIYPLNIGCVLLLGLVFSLFHFSDFFDQPNFYEILLIVVIAGFYFFQYIFFKRSINLNINESLSSSVYKKYLWFSLIGFFVEFGLYGVPLLSSSGRDEISGIPVLHVIFYSCAFVAVIFSSLYSKKIDIFFCLFTILILSVLLLSRQMMMISFLIFLIASSMRYNITASAFIKIIVSLMIVIVLFGVIGNLRQKLSGDYVDQYIIVIGGANANGEKLGDIFYWIWLYIASPVYNFWVNIGSYYRVGDLCNSNIYPGSCSGNYFSAVMLPDTFVKYLGFDRFDIDLQVQHLNVGTGFAAAARIWGVPGVLLQIVLQGFFYYFGYKIIAPKLKLAYVVYFSALSFFMIFDNLFVRAEFFFVFILLFLSRYKFTWGKS